jgi:hypothetical protein
MEHMLASSDSNLLSTATFHKSTKANGALGTILEQRIVLIEVNNTQLT